MAELPKIKISNGVIIGIAVGAAILAIVLFYENQNMRKQMVQAFAGKRKPCGCGERNVEDVAHASAAMATQKIAGVHESVITGRLNHQPMPSQSLDNPEHPPEVVL